jgi:hypothetical protein
MLLGEFAKVVLNEMLHVQFKNHSADSILLVH